MMKLLSDQEIQFFKEEGYLIKKTGHGSKFDFPCTGTALGQRI